MLRASPLATVGGLLLGGAIALTLFVRGLIFVPSTVELVHPVCVPGTPVARAGEPLRVMVWNVEFGAGHNQLFFYDGGQGVHVPPADVTESLDQIAELVGQLDPDVILFQEIDRGSDRTGRVDELRELLARRPYPCWASAPYHRAVYVPSPDFQHLGRVEMHLAVFSRVQLGEARRHQLPLLAEAWYRKIFNLRRAVLEVEVPVDGGPDLTILDTHLSAFSRGDGTLPRQVARLRSLARSAQEHGNSVLLAGDLNSLPPGDDPSRLNAEDQEMYSDSEPPIAGLFEDLTPVIPLATLEADPASWYTYTRFGQPPDRTIDYAFTGGAARASDPSVHQERLDISDHLPIVFTLRP